MTVQEAIEQGIAALELMISLETDPQWSIAGKPNTSHIFDDIFAAVRDQHQQAADILRALSGDLGALRAAVKVLIGVPEYYTWKTHAIESDYGCEYCDAEWLEGDEHHAPGCPVEAARAVLARMEERG